MFKGPIKKPLLAGALVSAAFAVAGLVGRRLLQGWDIHLVPRTAFGPAAVYNVEGDDGEPVRVLNVGGSIQSATYLDERYCEPVFAYYHLYDAAFQTGMDVRNVCMVGGGGYAYPKHLIATRPDARIDVVEVDPAVTSLARRYFFLDRLIAEYDLDDEQASWGRRLGLVEADGRSYLQEYAADPKRPRYDAVMNDCFSAGRPAVCLATVEAARAVRACLVPGGVYLTNVVGTLQGPGSRFLKAQAATLAQVFAHVYAIPCADGSATTADPGDRNAGDGHGPAGDNVMLLACDRTLSLAGAHELEGLSLGTVLSDAHCPLDELLR